MADSIEKMTGKRSIKSMISLLIFFLLIGAGGIGFYKFYEREKPQFSFKEDVSILGLQKEITFSAVDSRSGVSLITAQKDLMKQLF